MKKINHKLLYFIDKAIEEKKDIYIVDYAQFKVAKKGEYIQQLKIVYDKEHNSSILFYDIGIKNENFKETCTTSVWLHLTYIEKNTSLLLN